MDVCYAYRFLSYILEIYIKSNSEIESEKMNKRYVCSNIHGSILCCRIMFNNIAIKLQGFKLFVFHKRKTLREKKRERK